MAAINSIGDGVAHTARENGDASEALLAFEVTRTPDPIVAMACAPRVRPNLFAVFRDRSGPPAVPRPVAPRNF